MTPVGGAIFVPFPPETGTNSLPPPPPPIVKRVEIPFLLSNYHPWDLVIMIATKMQQCEDY